MLNGKITPLSNVLCGATITLEYGEGLFEFLNTDFSSAYETFRKELSGCQVLIVLIVPHRHCMPECSQALFFV